MAPNEKSFTSISGVRTYYARDTADTYGEGRPFTFYCTFAFYDLLTQCFDELWRECPLGTPRTIVSAGAYVAGKAGKHGEGRAIDLDSLWWNTKTFKAINYTTDTRFYLGVESIYQRHFVYVLDYNYNAAHQDHMHCDDTYTPQFSSTSDARVKYLQASLKYIHGKTSVVVDGVYGPITENTTKDVLASLGISGYITTVSVWKDYLLRTARLGMA
jgi:hypothetical protein